MTWSEAPRRPLVSSALLAIGLYRAFLVLRDFR